MKRSTLPFIGLLALLALSCAQAPKDWAWTEFRRPENARPVIAPDTLSCFDCPMKGAPVRWEFSDTFNPAAAVKNDSIIVLYRAEDARDQGIGMRTSRLGYAASTDGIHFTRSSAPVCYPGPDGQEVFENPGGCEDPRVCMTEDGLYVMMYTQWNRKVPRLAVATSPDLVHWTKYGPAFWDAQDGAWRDMACKSGSIVTRVVDGRQVIARIDGRYWMYWGEAFVNLATSEDLIHWTPMTDAKGGLLHVMDPQPGCFDSMLTECGPPAIITDRGILLLYNGKNHPDHGDPAYAVNTYCGGQALFSLKEPARLLDRLDKPFFFPEQDYEKSGQYPFGTVFLEGLVLYHGKWYLYYGCADSFVSVAIYDPKAGD